MECPWKFSSERAERATTPKATWASNMADISTPSTAHIIMEYESTRAIEDYSTIDNLSIGLL